MATTSDAWRSDPETAAWIRNALGQRIVMAERAAENIRQAYSTEPYLSASQVLVRLETMIAAMCRSALAHLDEKQKAAAAPEADHG